MGRCTRDALLHLLPPGIGFEMSTITDFNGVIGGSETRGTARGSDGTKYSFDTDMRFMRGVYVGLDGRVPPRIVRLYMNRLIPLRTRSAIRSSNSTTGSLE
jgi:hypothetical protein